MDAVTGAPARPDPAWRWLLQRKSQILCAGAEMGFNCTGSRQVGLEELLGSRLWGWLCWHAGCGQRCEVRGRWGDALVPSPHFPVFAEGLC